MAPRERGGLRPTCIPLVCDRADTRTSKALSPAAGSARVRARSTANPARNAQRICTHGVARTPDTASHARQSTPTSRRTSTDSCAVQDPRNGGLPNHCRHHRPRACKLGRLWPWPGPLLLSRCPCPGFSPQVPSGAERHRLFGGYGSRGWLNEYRRRCGARSSRLRVHASTGQGYAQRGTGAIAAPRSSCAAAGRGQDDGRPATKNQTGRHLPSIFSVTQAPSAWGTRGETRARQAARRPLAH